MLGDHRQERSERLCQGPNDGLLVAGLKAFGHVKDQLATAITFAPAFERGHDIFAGDRRIVMEHQPIAQGESIDQPVFGDFPAGHLRLRLKVLVHGGQHVIDHIAVVAGDMRGGDDRIKNPQARVHDRRDGRFAILRRQRAGRQKRRGGGEGGGKSARLFQCGS